MASVLVAPDSFKGTFSAVEVAEAIGRGLRAAGLECDLCPVADGGEGTMETLLERYLDNPIDYLPPSGEEAAIGSQNGEANA